VRRNDTWRSVEVPVLRAREMTCRALNPREAAHGRDTFESSRDNSGAVSICWSRSLVGWSAMSALLPGGTAISAGERTPSLTEQRLEVVERFSGRCIALGSRSLTTSQPSWLQIDPTCAPLRGTPRFERLVIGT
jgi:hypothetical protein